MALNQKIISSPLYKALDPPVASSCQNKHFVTKSYYNMKNKGTGFLKQIISVITAMAKSKTLALKSKTRAIKTRLIIFSLLRNKKLMMSSISDKLRTLMSHQQDHHHHKKDDDDDDDEDEEMGIDQNCSGTIVVHNAMSVHESVPNPTQTEEFVVDDVDEEQVIDYENENESNNKYPDLTHSLFEDPGGSVIDLVKNSKPEGEEFRLEDEIDQVADLFIKRFHRQMRIQKQLSFKRYQEMLERSS